MIHHLVFGRKAIVKNEGLILDLSFQNSFVDATGKNTMIAGGTSNQPTFALSGRKAGEYCAVFNGSQSIKTTTNLPVNSDKVTVAFWMKTTQTVVSVMIELSTNNNNNNAFGIFPNNTINKLTVSDRTTGLLNVVDSVSNVNTGEWIHCVVVIDRGLPGNLQSKIFLNGILSTEYLYATDLAGNFVNNILFIGQRGGSTFGLNGSLIKLKLYNYPFTASEVSNLYNSEL